MNTDEVLSISELPLAVDVPDQPCQQLYEAHPVLLGYDVVQYHFIPSYRDGGKAVRGKPEFAFNFQGYQFWFSTESNRNLFIGDPWKYAPAWGGFCSWGIALELPPQWPWKESWLGPPASPWEGWFLVDGVLMFNIWSSYTDRFLQNRDENVEKAVARWKSLRNGELKVGPFNTHCIGHGPLKNWCLSPQPHPWTESLPSCDVSVIENNEDSTANVTVSGCQEQAQLGELLSENCRDVLSVEGGGIVSDARGFNDFGNQSISPYTVRLLTICCSVGFVVIVLATLFCFRNRLRACLCHKKQDSPATEAGGKSVASDGTGDSLNGGHSNEDSQSAHFTTGGKDTGEHASSEVLTSTERAP